MMFYKTIYLTMKSILLFTAFLTIVIGTCPPGFSEYSNSCYMLFKELAKWPESIVYCNAVGAHLVTIETKNEDNYLIQLIADNEVTIPNEFISIWIGGHELVQVGHWQWAHTGKPIAPQWWADFQPDDRKIDPNRYPRCLCMFAHTAGHGWDDNQCENEYYFICEADVIPVSPIAG